MNSQKHKLCIVLDELEQDHAVQDNDSETEHAEPETEVWLFDPGICG